MALATYSIFGSRVPDGSIAAVDATVYMKGLKFKITSSIANSYFQPYTASVVGVKLYRGTLYAGSYTCSLWLSSSRTLLGETCSIPPKVSETGWVSASFPSPISISLDTDYVMVAYSYANGYTYFNAPFATPYYSSSVWNPLVGLHIGYTASGSLANPAPPFMPVNIGYVADNNAFGLDVVISASELLYSGSNTHGVATQGVNGYLQGINLGPTSIHGDSPMGRNLQVGVTQSLTEGLPSPPSLQLDIPGFWRFRWAVKAGARAIYVSAKQDISSGSYRPSMIVRNNPQVGLYTDLSGSAASAAGWQQIPLSFTATGNGVVWVELCNNDTSNYNNPAFFDHIITT